MNDLSVSSTISEATVFLQGAEITHQAAVKLIKGENTVIIKDLSAYLDVNSIKIKTGNGVLVTSFEHLAGHQQTEEPEEIKNLKKSAEKYREQYTQLETNVKINNNLLNVLQKSIDKIVSGGETGIGINDLMKTLDYYKTKSFELENSLIQDKKEQGEINASLQLIQTQIDSISRTLTYKSSLKVILAAQADIASNLTVTYHTTQAGWTPVHDINVVSIDKPIKITSKAQVRQTTGLDWERVKLKLSTSVPNSGRIAPLFSAWFLRPYVQPPASVMRQTIQNSFSYMKADRKTADVAYEAEESVMDEISMDQYVTMSDNQMDVSYDIDLPYSVSGDGKVQNIEIQNQEIEAIFKYYCAPKLDPATYLLAEISGWEKLNLLSGNANINFEGTYVGATYIDALSTKDMLALTLGHDKRVSVKREKMADYSSTKFFGNDVNKQFAYQLTVRNNQTKPIKMVLKDQYPISTQKEIVVELTKETTNPTFNISELGVVTWEFSMEPGEIRTFKLAYSVKHPKTMELNL